MASSTLGAISNAEEAAASLSGPIAGKHVLITGGASPAVRSPASPD